MESIFKYFETFLRLSPESKEIIASHLELTAVKKGGFLWKSGQKCSKLYFIKHCIVRLFFYNEYGEENTVHFVAANKFVTDLESLNTNSPSSISCITCIECEVISIASNALEKFNKEVFEWHELSKKITEKALFDKIRIRDILFQKEAKERYKCFLDLFPTVANIVPANQIASYLGMSQFTLSHLKKELAKDHFLRISKS